MSQNKIRILSRKSDLAIIQAKEIGYNLLSYFPDLKIEYFDLIFSILMEGSGCLIKIM